MTTFVYLKNINLKELVMFFIYIFMTNSQRYLYYVILTYTLSNDSLIHHIFIAFYIYFKISLMFSTYQKIK